MKTFLYYFFCVTRHPLVFHSHIKKKEKITQINNKSWYTKGDFHEFVNYNLSKFSRL